MTGTTVRKRLVFALALTVVFAAPLGAKTAVSVIQFQNTANNRQARWLSRGIADMLTTGLSQSPDVDLVERDDLKKVLDEHKLSLAGIAGAQNAMALGKILNARVLVTGSYILQGETLRVDAKVIDTETARVQSVQSTGRLADLFASVEDLSRRILFRIILKEGGPVVIQTNVLDAVRYYYEGLEELELSNTNSAIEKFRLAIDTDPLYSRPQKGLEEAYRFLKDFRRLRHQRELRALFDKLDRFRRRASEQPFRTYADIVTNAKWSAMTPAEREKFNRDNEAVILCSTPAQCAWHQEMTLLEIFDRKRGILDEEWDEREAAFREKERTARENRNAELKPLRDRKFDLLTNDRHKTRDREDVRRERDDLAKQTEELESRHDAQEKAFDTEQESLRRDRERAGLERERRDSVYLREIVRIATDARTRYARDSFLPEILYVELLAWRELRDYRSLKNYSESFLLNYPDYRLVTAVEDFYKTALDELKK